MKGQLVTKDTIRGTEMAALNKLTIRSWPEEI